MTIIIATATGTAIVTTDPSVEALRIQRDYEYYKGQLGYIQRQDAHDAMIEQFGGTRIDFAWQRAMERAQRRTMLKSADMLARFREQVEIDRFARAMAGSDVPVRAVPNVPAIQWDTEGEYTGIVLPCGPELPEDFQF